MAVALLGIAGAVAGTAVGTAAGWGAIAVSIAGSVGSALGSAAGSAIDAVLFAAPGTTVEGPRLTDRLVQDSTYGTPLPSLVGSNRLSGSVIWALPIEEVVTTKRTSGGKKGKGGGGKVTTNTYSYYATFAVALCDAEDFRIDDVARVWADNKVIFDSSAQPAVGQETSEVTDPETGQTTKVTFTFAGLWDQGGGYQAPGMVGSYTADAVRFYMGDQEEADPTIVAHEGLENACPYKGTAYIVFDRLALKDFSNRIPQISVEIRAKTPDAAPTVMHGAPTGVSAAGHLAQRPFALPGGRWATVAVDQGRFVCRTYRMNTRNDALDVIGTTYGPRLGVERVDALAPAMSPDGSYIAVVARQDGGPGGGKAHCAVWSHAAGDWLPGDDALAPGDGLSGLWGEDTVWIGSGCVATPSVDLTRARKVWHAWVPDPAANRLRYLGSGSHRSSWNGGIYAEHLRGASFIGLDDRRSLLVMDGVGGLSAATLGITATLTVDALGVPSGITFTDPAAAPVLLPGGWHAHDHRSPEWLRMGDTAVLLSSSRVSWESPLLLSLSGLNAGAPTVSRGAWSPPSPFIHHPCLAHIGGGRFACWGYSPVDGRSQIYGELEMTADGFAVTMPPVELTGISLASIATSRSNLGTSAVGGVAAFWQGAESGGSELVLIRRSPPTPDVPVAHAAEMVLQRYARLDPADYDVTALTPDIALKGYMVGRQTTARAALGQLATYAPFDIRESDGVIKAKLRTDEVDATIPDDDGRARNTSSGSSGQVPDPFERVRVPRQDLPVDVVVTYSDIDRDYQTGARRAQRTAAGPADASQESTVELPVTMTAGRAQDVADQALYQAWKQRDRVTFSLMPRWSHLEPGDVVTYRGMTLRLTAVKLGDGVVTVGAAPVSPYRYGHEAPVSEDPFRSQRPRLTPPTDLMLLDLPALSDEDAGQLGIYAAAACGEDWWPGVAVLESPDGGTNFDLWQSLGVRVVRGVADEALPLASESYWDESSLLTVRVPWGELETLPDDEVLAGGNLALVGDEVLAFRTAAYQGNGLYQLSGFLRGRRGTERHIAGHRAGERFVLLDRETLALGPVQPLQLGAPKTYRVSTVGSRVTLGRDVGATPSGETLRPYAPVHLRAARTDAGDVSLSWHRRTRVPGNGEWLPYADVRLDETAESYRVDVLRADGSVARTIETAAPAAAYPLAHQVTDFGAAVPEGALRVRVAMLSSLGLGAGHPATATL